MELPGEFIERTKPLLGEEWEDFLIALQEESPISIRLNPKKLKASFALDNPVPWASNAYYLDSRPIFTTDPLFHAGCYYVQEASSMYLEQIIKRQVKEAVNVLDLCAAPGGKSTHLLSTLPEGSFLVSNEVIRSRANILAENIIKWGYSNVMVTNNDPSDFQKTNFKFDVIVTDVPCSGEGMFRKNPKAIQEWSLGNVMLCAERQRRIIGDIWDSLKPGGLLVYSTCTYNREENEDNIEWICRELGAEIVEEPKRFLPHKSKGEGFFIAAVRKQGEDNEDNKGIASSSFEKKMRIVYPANSSQENKDKSAPQHSLAMSIEQTTDNYPRWEVDRETALLYLKREALRNMPDKLPLGYALITYKGQALGFVKNIGNRANNLYPQEWRIRMTL